MHMTHVLEQVMDDMVIEATKQVRDQEAFRGVIAGIIIWCLDQEYGIMPTRRGRGKQSLRACGW